MTGKPFKINIGRSRFFIAGGVEPEYPTCVPRFRIRQWPDGTPSLKFIWFGLYVALGWGRYRVLGRYVVYPAP